MMRQCYPSLRAIICAIKDGLGKVGDDFALMSSFERISRRHGGSGGVVALKTND